MKKCNAENKKRFKIHYMTDEQRKSEYSDEFNNGTERRFEIAELNTLKWFKPQFHLLLDRLVKSSSAEVKRKSLDHIVTLLKEALESTATQAS